MNWLWWKTRLAFEWMRSRTPFRHRSNLTKSRPSGWKHSLLAEYFEAMWSNVIATYALLGNSRRIQDIDALLHHFGINLSKVKGKGNVTVGLPLLLVLRSHAAYRSAASLALAGAVMEAMAVLRLSLETAAYANLMQGNLELATTWLNRGNDENTRKAARRAFTHGAVVAALRAKSDEVAGYYEGIYESLIDSGAHPNEFGFMTNMQVNRLDDGGAVFTQIYLQDDSRYLEMVLKATGQVGVCVLKIFELMYPKHFQELNISERIPQVASGI